MNETADILAMTPEGAVTSRELHGEIIGDELPMVVWLRGDEPFCGDFSLDAEAVMGQIGIKRTRLTQISGRELRVGRIRRGRYIVPLYRPQDVLEYLNWTRATATQQKSSQVVEQAAQHLRSAKDQIEQRLDEAHARILEQVDHAINGVLRFLQCDVLPKMRQLATVLDAIEGRQERLEIGTTRLRHELDQTMARAQGDQLKSLGALQLLTQDLADLKARVAVQEERREERENAFAAHLATLNAGLASILQKVSEEPPPAPAPVTTPVPPPRHRPNGWYRRRLAAPHPPEAMTLTPKSRDRPSPHGARPPKRLPRV